MSHVAAVQKADDAVQARLLRLLGRDTDWLYQEQYQRGLIWLGRWYNMTTDLYRALEGDRLFWTWWINQWRVTDQDFSQRLTVLPTGVASYLLDGGDRNFYEDAAALEGFYLDQHQPLKLRLNLPRFITDEIRRDLRRQGK